MATLLRYWFWAANDEFIILKKTPKNIQTNKQTPQQAPQHPTNTFHTLFFTQIFLYTMMHNDMLTVRQISTSLHNMKNSSAHIIYESNGRLQSTTKTIESPLGSKHCGGKFTSWVNKLEAGHCLWVTDSIQSRLHRCDTTAIRHQFTPSQPNSSSDVGSLSFVRKRPRNQTPLGRTMMTSLNPTAKVVSLLAYILYIGCVKKFQILLL